MLVITNYIFDEIVTLVNVRLGHSKAVMIGNVLMNSPEIEFVYINMVDELSDWNLFCNRVDKDYSYTDCTSFVAMNRMKITKALTLDEHFLQEGFEMIIKNDETK